MGSSANQDYCAYTKAVERLGDRWSLLILRELVMFGPQGFNQLATGLPGTISRSILATRLRKLEGLALIARDPLMPSRQAPYFLAPAGEELKPTMRALWSWAVRWVPEDPALAQRDPSIVLWWLARRVDPAAVPARQVVLDLAIRGTDAPHSWLVLARGTEPSLCLEDPLLSQDRYLYVEADVTAVFPIARGMRSWTDAIADGSVAIFGQPDLIRALPLWFRAKETVSVPGMRSVAAAIA